MTCSCINIVKGQKGRLKSAKIHITSTVDGKLINTLQSWAKVKVWINTHILLWSFN